MKAIDVKNNLIDLTEPHFLGKGFKLRRTDLEYVDKQGDISHIFRINIIAKTNWFIVSSEVYFGHVGINKIHKTVVNKETKLSGVTSGFGVRNKFPDRGNYSLKTEDQLLEIANKVILDFNEIGVPFFEKINSIADIDKYYNESKEIIGSQYSSCDAIIAAYLNNRDFHDLAQKYYDFWCKSQRELANIILETNRFLVEQENLLT